MKVKSLCIVLGLLLAVSLTACQKDKTGVYSPQKKIQRLYYSNAYHDKTPYQSWEWNGDLLGSITHYTESGFKGTWVEEFTYEDNRVVRVDNYTNSEYIAYEYDGDHLKSAIVYYRNTVVCKWDVSYDGDNIVKLTGTYYDSYKKDGARLHLNPLSHMLPHNVCDNVLKCEKKLAEQRHQEENHTLVLLLTWTDNNISRIVFTGDGEYVEMLLQYDDNNCPFHGFMGCLEDYLTNYISGHTGFSKHNVTSILATEDHYTDTICYAYQYDRDKYPVFQTMYDVDNPDNKEVFYFEYNESNGSPQNHPTDGVVVTTADLTFITSSTASCGAEVKADDAGLLVEIGVCCGLTENPTVDDRVVKSRYCSRPFCGLLTHLEPNTEYHVRGFAKYGTEYCYGPEKTFTTLQSDAPVASPVTTMPAYDITQTLSYNGNIVCSFMSKVVVEPFGITDWQAGVCYSQNPEFTVFDCEGFAYAYLESDEYVAYCTNLQIGITYYYRAFVAYNDGSGSTNCFYGETFSLTTPDNPLELELYTYCPYYDWSANYIQARGYVSCNKPEVINQVGFCYSTNNQYPQYESDLYTNAGTPTGNWYDFESFIYNLSANSKYYIRTYARYMNDSILYGNVEVIDTH